MSTQTNKLGLFKYDPIVDKEELFDIQEALNDNWDKIDNSIKNADWNQNDESAPDYVKNRTHYAEPALVSVLKETTNYFEEWSDNRSFNTDHFFEPSKEYTVTFDGVEYRCLSRDINGYTILIGNGELCYEDGGNNEPFCIRFTDDGEWGTSVVIFVRDGGEHTYSISTIGEVVHPIDEKFLPDTVATKADIREAITQSAPVIVDVEVVDSSTGKYKLVNHTYAELVEKLESGIAMLLKQPLNNNCFRYLNSGMRYTDTLELAFFVMQNNGQLFRALVKADDSVEILSWNFANANRTINGHNLKADITLTAADVGAATIEEVAEAVSELLGIAIGGSY